MSKIKITAVDTGNRKIYCRMVLRNVDENTDNSKKYFRGRYCDGETVLEAEKGRYRLEIYKGKFFKPYIKDIDVPEDAGDTTILINATLERTMSPRDLCLYSFDAHSHVSRRKLDAAETSDLKKASCVMKGEDYDFFFAGSPYDLDTHHQTMNGKHTDTVPYRRKYDAVISDVSDESFILDVGNEMVKGRYGHAFMVNYTQMPPFDKYYDETYDRWQFGKHGAEPEYKLSYMYEALLCEKLQNSAAILAHPTSWWYTEGEFITNIATTLGFELLAGSADAMVIMGYSKGGIWYEKLWFNALDAGYFLPGVAELDICFDDLPRSFDAYKTFVYCKNFDKDSLAEGIRKGRCIATSGPILELRVNGGIPGTVLEYNKGDMFEVEIRGHECCEAPLSKIQLIVNGKVQKEYCSDGSTHTVNEKISIKKDSYVIAKCWDKAGNIAVTNPVYIRNKPFVNKDFKSYVTVKVKNGGRKAEGVYRLGDSKEDMPFSGSIHVNIPPATPIHIFAGGRQKTIKLFELFRLQKIFGNLYLGKFNRRGKFTPGQVPAGEFKLNQTAKILRKVKIKTEM